MISNTKSQYGILSTYIHWVSALLVIALFAVGFWMVDLSYYSEWYRTAPYYHKAFGLTLLALTLGRVIWHRISKKPEPIGENKIEKAAASIAHKVLYLSLFVVMISGYLISTADGRGIEWFGLFTVPSIGELFESQEDIAGIVHEYSAYFILGLAVVHAAAALKHHFINKDETVTRITKFK